MLGLGTTVNSLRSLSRSLIGYVSMAVPSSALLFAPVVYRHWGISLGELWSTIAMYTITGLGVTIGYHRVLSHRSAHLSEKARTAILCAAAMAMQGPPTFWVAYHRAHHADPDGTADPHTPWGSGNRCTIGSILYSHFGWMLQQARFSPRLTRDLRSDEAVRRIDRHYHALILLGLFIPVAALSAFEPHRVLLALYWAGAVRLGLLHHATWLVNSACHLWGYRNFSTRDQSRNNVLVALLTFGEGWHNNHHARPDAANHGLRRWEVDATYA